MARYKFEVKKITCKHPTQDPYKGDEIYVVMVPVAGTVEEKAFKGEIQKGLVSETKREVRRNVSWTPKKNAVEVESGQEKTVSLRLMLFEADNEKLKKQFEKDVNDKKWPVAFDKKTNWSEIWDAAGFPGTFDPRNPEDWLKAVKSVLRIVVKAVEVFRRDDYIGAVSLSHGLDDPASTAHVEFRWDEAHYDLDVHFSKV